MSACPSCQVHVGEYGVHWNFFFTLAAVSLLTNIINIPVHQSGVFGLSILVVYQLCLLSGLNDYLNSTQRGVDWISQNKEGIYSLVGYWSLYLLGVQLGYFFELRKSKSGFSNPAGAASIWALAFLFWSLTAFCDRFLERTSRRSLVAQSSKAKDKGKALMANVKKADPDGWQQPKKVLSPKTKPLQARNWSATTPTPGQISVDTSPASRLCTDVLKKGLRMLDVDDMDVLHVHAQPDQHEDMAVA
ncbi:hypothetical protein L7F22_044891 [Adiantum nelumboides]|nr:hypothetical protein [Adiantum nelumboides]